MAEEFEGFIETGVDTDDVHEAQPVPTGAYDLTIVSAKGKKDGEGNMKSVQCVIEIAGVPNAAAVFHTITLWNKDEEKKKRDFKIVLAKKFYKLFGVTFPSTGINTTDLIGARASQVLLDLRPESQSSDGSKTYPPSNAINLNSVHV